MKQYLVGIIAFLAILLVIGGQCQQPAITPTAPAAPETQPTQAAVLEVVGLDGTTRSLTLDEVKTLSAYEGWGGSMSSTGRITPPAKTKGVLVEELCQLVGGLQPGTGVRVVAQDGYAMTYSYDQIVNGDFIAYDPGTGKETQTSDRLRAVVYYERDGKPNDPQEDGVLRMALLSSDNMQITDGHWWIKWVRRIVIKSLAEDWTVQLEGTLTEKMDQASFESCAAPGCHGATWKDAKAQVWTGVPLWLLVGRVDDETQHGDVAYDRALADAGYKVDVVAADGYSVTFDSKQIKENSNLLVAHMVNDNPLDEKHFPLRLVGSELDKKGTVGQIAQIVVHVPQATPTPQPTPVPTKAAPAPTGDAALTISGAVEQPTSWTMAEFEALKVEKVTVEHPKKGQQTYTGMRLNALLDLAKPQAKATAIVFTSADGYTIKVPLAEVRACADCLIAFNDKGGLGAVMPGFDTSAWAKDVIQIEVQ